MVKSDKEIRESFDRIYREYRLDIYRTALNYAKNADAAHEATQMAFYKLYLEFERVEEETVKGLLITIVKRIILNQQRSAKHLATGEFLDVLDEKASAITLEDAYIEAESRAEKKDLCTSILDHLRCENPAWHDALIQVYYLEKPQAQVAKEMNVSLQVLHSRLYRAKRWIKKNYKEEYDEIIGWD